MKVPFEDPEMRSHSPSLVSQTTYAGCSMKATRKAGNPRSDLAQACGWHEISEGPATGHFPES